MNQPKSEFNADLLLWVFAREPYLPLYIGLVASLGIMPGTPVTINEVSGGGYERCPIKFRPVENGFAGIVEDIKFPTTKSRWRNITHLAIYDAKEGGNRLLLKPCGGYTTIEIGESVSFMADEFRLFVGYNSINQNQMI
jgi:hypothetical protein